MVNGSRRKVLKSIAGAAAFGIGAPGIAHGSPTQIRIGYQLSLNYLPLMIIEHDRLLERALRRQGQDAETSWLNFSSGPAMNDALLSGQIDIASGGITILATLWEKTRGNLEVKGLTALAASPFFLNSNKPAIRSLNDFSAGDRIALPAAKTSPNAIVLQMAAEIEFGLGQHDRLDPLTVSMPNPDAQAALASRRTEIVAHMVAPPFCFEQLQFPGIHRVLSSAEVLGDGATTIVTWTAKRLGISNPAVVDAFIGAITDANAMIETEPAKAAAIYKAVMRSNQSVADLEAIILRPEISFSLAPRNSLLMVDFMHRVGTLKAKPANWKEFFFANIHGLPGS